MREGDGPRFSLQAISAVGCVAVLVCSGVWWCGCVVVSLCGGVAVWWCGCVVVWVCGGVVVCVFRCVVVEVLVMCVASVRVSVPGWVCASGCISEKISPLDQGCVPKCGDFRRAVRYLFK